eukprot:2754241-Prymnesium_polylepis.1
MSEFKAVVKDVQLETKHLRFDVMCGLFKRTNAPNATNAPNSIEAAAQRKKSKRAAHAKGAEEGGTQAMPDKRVGVGGKKDKGGHDDKKARTERRKAEKTTRTNRLREEEEKADQEL